MRLFNPVTLTEVIPGLHDTSQATGLPDDHWFFTYDYLPDGMALAVNEAGEPALEKIDTSHVK
ncbi:hypothetical protein [Erwinia sp. 9145]|uniref:hypothetical protein n=1 Tax=Erwinia sp. 9145 TaxID=1500895 RepID=UPI0005542A47|nr:hypothetical protein [Erwinia sp. 9145]